MGERAPQAVASTSNLPAALSPGSSGLGCTHRTPRAQTPAPLQPAASLGRPVPRDLQARGSCSRGGRMAFLAPALNTRTAEQSQRAGQARLPEQPSLRSSEHGCGALSTLLSVGAIQHSASAIAAWELALTVQPKPLDCTTVPRFSAALQGSAGTAPRRWVLRLHRPRPVVAAGRSFLTGSRGRVCAILHHPAKLLSYWNNNLLLTRVDGAGGGGSEQRVAQDGQMHPWAVGPSAWTD